MDVSVKKAYINAQESKEVFHFVSSLDMNVTGSLCESTV